MKEPNPYIGPKNSVRRMEYYDNMRPELRQNHAYSMISYKVTTDLDYKWGAMDLYGPDHPQAQGDFCWPLRK